MSRKVHCMSLSSIHILYNHTPTALLKAYTEPWCGLIIFHWTEVVLRGVIVRLKTVAVLESGDATPALKSCSHPPIVRD